MDEFEQDVRRATANFLADLRELAKRAVLEVISSAFDDMSRQLSDAITAQGQAQSAPAARRRASTRADPAELRMRVMASLREHPGPTTTQLSKALGIHSSKLRQVLRTLADEGSIRIEESTDTLFGGQRCRAYFAVDDASRAAAEPLPRAAEAA